MNGPYKFESIVKKLYIYLTNMIVGLYDQWKSSKTCCQIGICRYNGSPLPLLCLLVLISQEACATHQCIKNWPRGSAA
jgi:hypothetical protein